MILMIEYSIEHEFAVENCYWFHVLVLIYHS